LASPGGRGKDRRGDRRGGSNRGEEGRDSPSRSTDKRSHVEIPLRSSTNNEDDLDDDEYLADSGTKSGNTSGATTPSEVTPRKELSLEEIQAKIESLLEEYLEARDPEEAILCLHELHAPEALHEVVYKGIMSVLEKKESDCKLMVDLFDVLCTKKVLTEAQWQKGCVFSLWFALLGETGN
jgi:hypothetical protein